MINFLSMLQTCNEFPVLGTLDMSSYFHTKSIIQLVEDLIFNSIRNFFLEMLFDPSFHDHAYHLVGIFDILIVEINLKEIMMSINIQKVNFISNVFCREIVKTFQLAILGNLGMLDHTYSMLICM